VEIENSNFMKYGLLSFIGIVILCIILITVLTTMDDTNNRIFVTGQDNINYNTIAKITHKCYFDLQVNDQSLGRIIIALFGQAVPYTVRNFVELCSGVNGLS